ncbi:MAG: hypothetical protein WBX11_06475 [Thiobacillaceae bacterium]
MDFAAPNGVAKDRLKGVVPIHRKRRQVHHESYYCENRLGEDLCSRHGVDANGKVALKKMQSQDKLLDCFAKLPSERLMSP